MGLKRPLFEKWDRIEIDFIQFDKMGYLLPGVQQCQAYRPVADRHDIETSTALIVEGITPAPPDILLNLSTEKRWNLEDENE